MKDARRALELFGHCTYRMEGYLKCAIEKRARVRELEMLLGRAKEWIEKHHEMPGYSELLADIEKAGVK